MNNRYDGDLSSSVVREKIHRIQTNVRILDRMYPKCRISVFFAKGKFGPDAVGKISELLKIPRNFMFISSPGGGGGFAGGVNIAELGGCRVITH